MSRPTTQSWWSGPLKNLVSTSRLLFDIPVALGPDKNGRGMLSTTGQSRGRILFIELIAA